MASIVDTRIVHAPDRTAERLPYLDFDLPPVPSHDVLQVEIALDDGRIVIYETDYLTTPVLAILAAVEEETRPDYSAIIANREMLDERGIGWESVRNG